MQVSPEVVALHQAIHDSDLAQVRHLLATPGFNPDAPAGMTSSLATAVATSNMEICRELVAAGAHVNFGGRSGRFPLYIAARKGDLHMVKFLLKSGASVDMQYVTGNSALLEAVVRSHLDIVHHLVEIGANVHLTNNAGESGLHLAAFKGSVSLLMVFLNAGVNVNLVKYEGPKKAVSTGMVPLHMTAFGPQGGYGGHSRVAEVLLDHGADINAAMTNGRTTLHLAAMRGTMGVAEVLLQHGCHVDPVSMENDEHKTPLMKAVDGGHKPMVDRLIQAGADINFRDLWGSSPLITAVFNGKIGIVNSLLTASCDVNLASRGGLTPIKASLRHPPHLTQMLVLAGCDLGQDFKAVLDDPRDNLLYEGYPEVRSWILSLIESPKSLQQLCRELLRRTLGIRPATKLAALDLPPRLKDYVLLKDCDHFLTLYDKADGAGELS